MKTLNTFTGGPIMDTLVLKYAGKPQQVIHEFQQAAAERAPDTAVSVLTPEEPLVVGEQ